MNWKNGELPTGMSALRMKNHWRFFDALKARGMTLKALAAQAGVSRPHLSLVIEGTPGRGGQVRRKVAPLLTDAERQLLGWSEQGELIQRP